ncbi:MAG: formylglycine-generating enzyme family protein [Chitinophagales bacterium]
MNQTPTKIVTLQHPTTGETFNIKLIEVEGGTFEMGSEKDGDEKPIHEVSVPTFNIGKYPVTQALYVFVMGKAENRSRFKGKDRPVETVSWEDAKRFLQKLNNDFGNFEFRLPSESEWEYAARGGKDWGDKFDYAGSKNIEEVAWYDENSHWETNPVGWKKANQLGIYDMSGNVWEWCEDDYHSDYENAPKDGSAWIDEPRASSCVVRGGGWDYFDSSCRVAYRSYDLPSYRDNYVGFRLVLPQFNR